MKKTTQKFINGFMQISKKSIEHNANTTTSTWLYQPKAPTSIEKFKKN